MEIIRPFEVNDTTLASSSVPEVPPSAWNSGTTYALDATVSVFTGTAATVYRSLQGSNTNHDPAASPTWWEAIGDTYSLYSGTTLYLLGEKVIGTDHHEYESLSGVNAGTVTITNANPGIVTKTAHGLTANTPVLFTSTGALPTGLSVGTIYYVRNATTDTFELSATVNGTSIDTTGSQSGVHTLYTNPNKGYPLTDPAHWLDLGSNNRWRMFDQTNSSQTIVPEEIDVTIDVTGRANGVSLLNMVAATVQIIATTDEDGEIFNETYNLVSDSGVTNWYDYFFEPVIRIGDLVVNNIPLNADPHIRVIVSEPGGNAYLGTLVIGQSLILGGTVYGAKIGIQDYSRKVTDEFGNFTIVERAFAKRATFKVAMSAGKVDAAAAFLATIRATPVVYKGTDQYASTYIYGFFKNWDIEISHPDLSYCSLDIEGLT